MKKLKADLWEDTIIIAMRDMQWSNFIRWRDSVVRNATRNQDLVSSGVTRRVKLTDELEAVRPPGFVKLDGNAETKLSDVALKAGERFFLMEVKSTFSKVRTEWRKKGKYFPKFMLQRLSELVECAETNPDADAMLDLCLRGHYATYWSPQEVNGGLRGTVVSMPYVVACETARNGSDIAKRRGVRLNRAFYPGIRSADNPDRSFKGIAFEELMKGLGEMQLHEEQSHMPLGLDEAEFLKYTAFLCGGDADSNGFELPSDHSVEARLHEPLHLVSLSTVGTHMKVMGSTAHLAALLDGKFRPSPRWGASANLQSSKPNASRGSAPKG
ncbi:hypothetical protein SE336_15775 [Xanthomonas arboricola]|uniref:hypothetical protein n=1 Tax=Xanthomonas arboricola TaxID=56448 RepID=UPI0039F4C69E